MPLVNLESLFRQQVYRDGVAAEGVEDEQVEVLRRFPFQGKAGVADCYFDRGGGVGKVAEPLVGHRLDLGVNLIKAQVVSRPAKRRHSAGAKTYHTDAPRARGSAATPSPMPLSSP